MSNTANARAIADLRDGYTTLSAQVGEVRTELADLRGLIVAYLDGQGSAKAVTPPKTDARPKAGKAAPKPTKGAQTRETLSRKDWNRTLTAKARRAGKIQGVSVISIVMAHWAWVQENARNQGWTPDETLAYLTR